MLQLLQRLLGELLIVVRIHLKTHRTDSVIFEQQVLRKLTQRSVAVADADLSLLNNQDMSQDAPGFWMKNDGSSDFAVGCVGNVCVHPRTHLSDVRKEYSGWQDFCIALYDSRTLTTPS